ncbi:Lanthionine synthetase C-like protein [Marasmius fiardii PR-910]|nr:Lanthionine synthetase C-like protein [Marasmius fiardii PR-910]
MPTRYIRHSIEPPTDLEVIEGRLGRELERYLKVLRDNRAHLRGDSVYTGIPGVILMQQTLSSLPSVHPDLSVNYPLDPNNLHELLCLETVQSYSSSNPAKVSFLETPIGLAVLAILNLTAGSSSPFTEKLRDAVDSIAGQKSNSDDGSEVLYGRAGFLYGLLYLRKSVHRRSSTGRNESAEEELIALEKLVSDHSLSIVIRSVIHRGRVGAELYASETPSARETSVRVPPLMWSWHGKRYLGAAHGVVGILHILLLCPIALIERYLPEIIQTIEWVVSLQDEEGNWPTKAPNRAVSHHSRKEANDLVQWCHGAPGTLILLSRFLQLSYLEPEKVNISSSTHSHIVASLRGGASIVYRHGLLRKGIGLCHGIAGSVYSLLAVADAMALVDDVENTGNKRNSHYYFTRAAHLAELATHFEGFTKDGEMKVPDRPLSMFEGMAGMCCAWGEVCDRIRQTSNRREKWYRPRSGMPGYDDL